MNDRYQIYHAGTMLPVMRYDQYDGHYHEWFCYSVDDANYWLEFVIEEHQDDDFVIALVCSVPIHHRGCGDIECTYCLHEHGIERLSP